MKRRVQGVSNLEFFRAELNSAAREVIDAAAPNPCLVFLAVRTVHGVECWRARCRWDRYGRFEYWLDRESDGIYDSNCPRRILDQLDPVEQLYSDLGAARARRFRESCRRRLEKLAALPKVKRGDLVEFKPAVEFRGGHVRDVLEYVRGSEFRAGRWRFFLGADWKLHHNWSVMEDVTAEERELLLL